MSARIAERTRLGRARRAAERGCGAGLTEFAGAVGLALVQIHPTGVRTGLGAGLCVPPRPIQARRRRRRRGARGRRGGARPVGVSEAVEGARRRARGGEAQGEGALTGRGILRRGGAARRRAVLRLREARARRAGGRARGLPEASPVLGGRRRLPAPRVRPGGRSGLGDWLFPRPRRLLRARTAAGIGVPVVGRRGCGEKRGREAGRGGEADGEKEDRAPGGERRWGQCKHSQHLREETGEARGPGSEEKRREGERRAPWRSGEGSLRCWSVSWAPRKAEMRVLPSKPEAS